MPPTSPQTNCHENAAPAKVGTVSVVIPVYNSAPTLGMLVQRLRAALEPRNAAYEVILVDDGSKDGSWEAILGLARQELWLKGIRMMRNYGQHNALLCGIRAATHEVIVTLDDDLQNPPEEIARLLAKLAEGYDVVYGKPEKEQHGLWRDLASQVTKMGLQTAMGSETARNVSAFRAFRTQLRDAFASYHGAFVSIDVLLTWATTRFAAVTVRHEPRQEGVSNYTFRKLVVHALNMVTGFSVLPLQIASVMGFCFTMFGIVILFYVLFHYLLFGGSVPGFPFLASIIAIFSGAQMFAIGVIGEYLARMHFRMMDRPVYAVRTVANLS